LLIRDTKSNFGTFVNGERLAKKNQLSIPRKIKSGDVVKLGKDFRGGINERQRAVLVRIELDSPAVAPAAVAADAASMMTN
jgi:pSer/pThr/pTyr-binding forkhead associated (FHA) protein